MGEKRRLSFGSFVLDLEAGTLSGHGVPLAPSYRGLLLLAALARKPGEVISKSDLMEVAWPGLAVEEGNLTVQIAGLRKLLGHGPDGRDWIATVPRVGYRFQGVVSAEPAAPGPAPSETRPSIAVLPFSSLSEDAEQRHFAEGLSEDIITRIARLRWLFVSARNSTFTYRGAAMDAQQIGRELGVRYVLKGSVRKDGGRIRTHASLSDATTGLQVWAERYDIETADFFTLQDRIGEHVIAAIEPRLHEAEHNRFRTRSPESLDAWGYVMQAMPYVWTWGSAAELDLAEGLLRSALKLDPDYPRANSLVAWILAARVQLGWVTDRDALRTAKEMAQRAIMRAPEDPWPHFAAGYVHMVSRNHDPAVAAINEAIDINPSFAVAHMILGSIYAYGGMPPDGLHHLALAERLSPRDFTQAAILATVGLCHFMAGRYETAIALEQRAVALRPHFGTAWRTLAASAGNAGQHAVATHALAEARRLHPSLSLDWVEQYHPIVHAEDRARYAEGLRAAGLA